MRILITGGTGTLGRRVAPQLLQAGHDVVVGTRTPSRPDHRALELASGDGLDGALEGVDAVIHLATDARAAQRLDVVGTSNLLEAMAGRRAFLVYVSIVGIDDHPFPYYRAKAQAEQLIERSSVPWTILRATQFHDLIGRFVDPFARLPVMLAPSSTPIQPIDPEVVASRLVELTESGPAGRVPDMGGPDVLDFATMATAYLRRRGLRRLVIPVPFPGAAAAAFRGGSVLCDHHDRSGRTWYEWLEEEVQP